MAGRPTLADVAREAGVSRALVSIVMRDAPGASEATRTRVKAVADRLGYVPDERARKLRQSSSRLVGVTFDLHQPFHGDLVEQLYAVAAEHGYDLAISAVAPSRDESMALEALRRERCEAVVLLGSGLDDDALTATARLVPLLLVARHSDIATVPSVRSDDVAGVGLAVDHLVTLGHRSIVHVDGGTAPGAQERRVGFHEAAARHGLTDARVVPGGATEEAGVRAARALLQDGPPPPAVVAFNDHCASGILDVLLRERIDVPDRVSVVGYDDSRLAVARQTQLTTVSQSAAALARSALEGALALVDGTRPADVVLTPELVVRETTAPPVDGRAGPPVTTS